jgi:hypothetical protein
MSVHIIKEPRNPSPSKHSVWTTVGTILSHLPFSEPHDLFTGAAEVVPSGE